MPSTLTAKPVLSQTSPRPINGLPRCASSICNPGSESANFCAAIAIDRQTIGPGSTRGGSAGMSRKLAAAWPPPEIARPPTEYLMITNERQKTTDCVEELGGRGGRADIGVTSDCAASLGGGDCLLSGYELGQLAEVLGDCSEVEFVAGTARPTQP